MSSKKMNSLVVAVLTAVVALAGTASATFPGKNGKIAFIEPPDVYTMNPDGTDEHQLTSLGPNSRACCEAWSPDGTELVFSEFASNTAPGQLWIMNADGSNQHLLLSDPSFNDVTPSFSPDGSMVVFARCGPVEQCAIYRVRADGNGLTAITHLNHPGVADTDPAYSPDGTTIAFSSFNRAGVIAATYLMKADGSHIGRLTPPELEAFVPDWSPDGEEIVFSTRASYPPNTDTPEIWVVNVHRVGLRRLTDPSTRLDFAPSWSPQGNAIAFERDNASFTSFAIYLINPDGSGLSNNLQDSVRKTFELPLTHQKSAQKRNGNSSTLRLIEGDGFNPRWGQAPPN